VSYLSHTWFRQIQHRSCRIGSLRSTLAHPDDERLVDRGKFDGGGDCLNVDLSCCNVLRYASAARWARNSSVASLLKTLVTAWKIVCGCNRIAALRFPIFPKFRNSNGSTAHRWRGHITIGDTEDESERSVQRVVSVRFLNVDVLGK
jgi:hypothetical protein